MTTFAQIAAGSAVLGLCSAVHLILLIRSVNVLGRFHKHHTRLHWGWFIAGAFTAVVLGHTIQVWIWAICFVMLEAFATLDQALYFSLTTYTTLGYGDIIVGEGIRIFAAMGAVTGLLNFGLSTAFLVELVIRYLPDDEA
ncbi:potassium channel family protein [uncultured Litoreibacter sp.]|uniref:potassium channel family protein n=1 Tax=uncultured Litoreibacter sp. TaxID=1392394 RepID=UPI00262E26FD|nr:potassium channel family protein [uncultured Litoreibacter sp.]